LTAAGFTNVIGPSNSENATEFWITPIGGSRTQISPPGTTPKLRYDLGSEIALVGSSSGRLNF
jgi:hypothetical protein